MADATDPDGDPLVFRWSVTGGTLSADTTPRVDWMPSRSGQVVVSVTVTDGLGGSATATLHLNARAQPTAARPPATRPPANVGETPVGAVESPAAGAAPPPPAVPPASFPPAESAPTPAPVPATPSAAAPEPTAAAQAVTPTFQWALLLSGLLLVLLIVAAAFVVPQPTAFQQLVFRTALALGAASVAASIPWFVGNQTTVMNAGAVAGGLAVFVLVYGFNPMSRARRDDERMPAAIPMPVPSARRAPESSIFISYRRSETTDVVGRLHERLEEHFGPKTVFKDANDIMPGMRFKDVIADALRQCRVVVVVIGPDWERLRDDHDQRKLDDPNDFVLIEVGTALVRRLPVIPTLVGRTELPSAQALPPAITNLRDYQALLLRPDPDFDHDADRLIGAIEALLARAGVGA